MINIFIQRFSQSSEATKIVMTSALIFLAILSITFATGQTFGQRCSSSGFSKDTPEWNQCVHKLSKGQKS